MSERIFARLEQSGIVVQSSEQSWYRFGNSELVLRQNKVPASLPILH